MSSSADLTETSSADFRASRDEVLSRRMRSARAAGSVPMWQVMDVHAEVQAETTLATGAAAKSPSEAHEGHEGHEAHDEAHKAPVHSSVEPWALAAGLVALLVIAVLVGTLLVHRSKYGRAE